MNTDISSELTSLVSKILSRFQQYESTFSEALKKESANRFTISYKAKSDICKQMYLETKNFLDEHQDALTPDEKFTVFNAYVALWRKIQGVLDLEEIDAAERYQEKCFGKYDGDYNCFVPMCLDFNLKDINFGKFFASDMIFINVNFSGADLTNASLPYSHFLECNFIDSKLVNANFNQCRFDTCHLEGVDLRSRNLCETGFINCYMHSAQYDFSRYGFTAPFMRGCFTEFPYIQQNEYGQTPLLNKPILTKQEYHVLQEALSIAQNWQCDILVKKIETHEGYQKAQNISNKTNRQIHDELLGRGFLNTDSARRESYRDACGEDRFTYQQRYSMNQYPSRK